MADKEHLDIFMQGAELWNQWRKKTDQVVDLSAANLSNAHLINVNLNHTNLNDVNFSGTYFFRASFFRAKLNRVDLSKADLRHANFDGARLGSANLSQAKLIEASLKGARLNQANLTETDFYGADLTDARLRRANLTRAELRKANFYNSDLQEAFLDSAKLGATIFGNTDLKNAKCLDRCLHLGPSVIDHQTLARSEKLPLNFLRGCGLPDTFIEYLPSLLNEPIQFYSCFISYSSTNQIFAERLHADLQNEGVRCWFAPEDLKIGDRFRQTIDESIRLHDKLLLILSENSISSPWVQDEVESALERERRENKLILFPVRIDDVVMHTNQAWAASLRRSRHIGDFTGWKDYDEYHKAFDRLMKDLKADDSIESRA